MAVVNVGGLALACAEGIHGHLPYYRNKFLFALYSDNPISKARWRTRYYDKRHCNDVPFFPGKKKLIPL